MDTLDEIKRKRGEVEILLDDDAHIRTLSGFQRGVLSGIYQTLLWLDEPDKWMEPLSVIGGHYGKGEND